MQQKKKGWLNSEWDKTQSVNARISARNKRWEVLHKAGGGSVSDYIKSDFGSECPNGFDTKPWPDQKVNLENLFSSPNFKSKNLFKKVTSLRWGGWVQCDKQDTIHLNPIYYSEGNLNVRNIVRSLVGKEPVSLSDIIPHEFIHTRQNFYDHSGWGRNEGNFDIKYTGMSELSQLNRTWRNISRRFHNAKSAIQSRAGNISSYYGSDVEMQARMHEMIAIGYAQWQVMPTSKIELQAALVNLGMKAPRETLEELKGSEEGQVALKKFSVLSGIKSSVSGTTLTFNRIHDYIGEKDVQKAMWDAKYPLLYGELIEFYGDELGRERMGLGNNPRPVIEVLYELDENDSRIMRLEELTKMAERIPATNATAFLNTVCKWYDNDTEGLDNAMRLSQELLKRTEVKEVVFADKLRVRTWIGQDEYPSLQYAMIAGNKIMAELLLDAGADPFQTYEVEDMRGKFLFADYPLSSCITGIENLEKNISDPSRLPKKAQKPYKDDKVVSGMRDQIIKEKEIVQEIINRTDDPDELRDVCSRDGSKTKTSLNKLIAEIGMTAKSKTTEAKLDHGKY